MIETLFIGLVVLTLALGSLHVGYRIEDAAEAVREQNEILRQNRRR